MTTPAQNDALLQRWINADNQAAKLEAKVRAESHASANLPIPVPPAQDVEAAGAARQASNLAMSEFLRSNGLMVSFGGKKQPLSKSTEFQRLIATAPGRGASSAILNVLDKSFHTALSSEAGIFGTNPVTGKPSALAGVATFALLTAPAWLTMLLLRKKR